MSPFLKENETGKTSTPECSPTHNQNKHYLNTIKTNNTIKKERMFNPPCETNTRTKKQPKPYRLMSCFSNYIKITVYTTVDKKHPPIKKGRPKKIMSNINHYVHRVCTVQNTPPHFDQNRSNIHKNSSSTLLLLIKQHYYVYYSILTVNNMFNGLLRFIFHLFISITSLLYIYSLLFIFLLVYIIYYLFLFLEEKNNQFRKLVFQLSYYENQLFITNNRRY